LRFISAQIAGNGHLAFAGHYGGFDGEQLAAKLDCAIFLLAAEEVKCAPNSAKP
jgi:hypothetical protein